MRNVITLRPVSLKAAVKVIITMLVLAITACTPLKAQTVVKMQREGGVYTVPCKVNGLALRFIFDTGASSVCISATEAVFMRKNGYLSDDDIIGRNYSKVANGDIVEGVTINLRRVEIGGLLLTNVSAPLLFGQTAIQKLGPIKLDGDNLIIGRVSVLNREQLMSKARAIYSKAFMASESGRYEESVSLYKKAIDIYPLPELYDGLAYSYQQMGRKDEALKAAETAFSMDTQNLQFEYNYACMLYNNGKNDTAEKYFTEIYDKVFYNSRHKGTSKESLQAMVAACNFLGAIYKDRGEYARAEQWLTKGIGISAQASLGPDIYAYRLLADLAIDAKDYSKATTLLRAATADAPDNCENIPCYYKMAMCSHNAGTDSTGYFLTKAIKIYESNTEAVKDAPSDLHLFSYAMNSYMAAARDLYRIIRKNNAFSTSGNIVAGLANMYYCKFFFGCLEESKKGRNDMPEPGRKDFERWLACSIMAGEDSVAVAAAQLLARIDPENINLAYIKDNGADAQKSIQICTAVLSHYDMFALTSKENVLTRLAEAQMQAGDCEAARKSIETALKTDRNDGYKWVVCGKVMKRLGRYKQAANAFDNALSTAGEKEKQDSWYKEAQDERESLKEMQKQ